MTRKMLRWCFPASATSVTRRGLLLASALLLFCGCSGLAAAATGFVLKNNGLIISGALVGASGIILTQLMCRAMNRSLANVLFGAVGRVISGPDAAKKKRVRSWTAQDAAMVLESASLVVIVPGYGMAVAQAQHAVKDLADRLTQRGVTV